mgnify:CR=1 FL=1
MNDAEDALRAINSELYTRCPACHFEEYHLASCVVGKLEARIEQLEKTHCPGCEC